MENLKLISVRIDPITLEKIDAYSKKHKYWKRNTIINHILSAVVDAMDDKSLYDMMRYYRYSDVNPLGNFSLDKKRSPDVVPNPGVK